MKVSRQQTNIATGITYHRPPDCWHNGFPLGNGFLGAMVWGNGNPLALTLDCTDLWDLRINTDFMKHPDYNYAGLRRLINEKRYDKAKEIFEDCERKNNPIGPTKISVGRAELALGAAREYMCRLDLGQALIEGTIRTTSVTHGVTCFVHHDRPLLCLRVTDVSAGTELKLRPLAELDNGLAKLNHPAPLRRVEGDLRLLIQSIPEGPHYAIIWNINGPDFFLALELAENAEKAEAKARATWQKAAQTGFDRLLREHKRAWKKFWSVSAVYLPEAHLEYFWRFGIYLLASSARRGSNPPGLQGVWAMDGVMPPWHGDYHADLNVQETFWPAAATGHLELLDVWCDHMKACIRPAQSFTRRFFGTEGTFWTCATLPNYTMVPGWYTVEFGLSHAAFLGWLVWLRWRHSLDIAWLKDTGYPIMVEIFKFYRGILEEEADGCLHVPLSTSPEYEHNRGAAWCKDPTIDLALIRKCCDWIVDMENALEITDFSESAMTVHAKLAPYPLTEKQELCLWPGHPLDESHLSPSHLMPIHPAMDLTIEGDEREQAIIKASIKHYQALGQYLWAGHTYAQLISMAAVLGRAGWAYDSLRLFTEHWSRPNGLHVNADILDSGMSQYRYDDHRQAPFTMEANCAVTAGICDMLVQGWHDIVRVFPAIPEHWRNLAFRDLVAEGAFKVSAVRRDGKTVWVQVKAGVTRTLRLKNPFGDQPVNSTGPSARREGNLWIAELKAGESIVLAVTDTIMDWKMVVRTVRENPASRLGLQ